MRAASPINILTNWKTLAGRFTVDVPLLLAVVALCLLSMTVLYSSSGESTEILAKHGARIAFGLVLMLVVAHIPLTALKLSARGLYAIGIVLLLIIYFGGGSGKGVQRWIDVGIIRFQPSEFMKVLVPMFVAWALSRERLPPSVSNIVFALLAIIFPVLLVLNQPDLGTAILIAFSGVLVIFLAGIRWKVVATAVGCVGLSVPLLWTQVFHDYQRDRILYLLDPWAEPLGGGYHTIQSTIAVGSGGMLGKGWLSGTQTQLDFIPERTTDFVFAVFAEEFGFLGSIILLSLYVFIAMRGIVISISARDTYSRLLGTCLSITFFIHAFVNMGMVVGMLPVVGVPLPLLSYGGSLLSTIMVGLGIIMSIQRHK